MHLEHCQGCYYPTQHTHNIPTEGVANALLCVQTRILAHKHSVVQHCLKIELGKVLLFLQYALFKRDVTMLHIIHCSVAPIVLQKYRHQ